LNDIFTIKDSNTYCPVRIFGAIGFIHYLVLSTLELTKHCSDFSLTEMATGITVIIGVISAGISLKNKADQ